jgi:serine/threonine protein kinase
MKRDGIAPKRKAKITIPFMMKTQIIQKYQEIDQLLKQTPYVGEYAWYIILALVVLIIALLVKSMVKRKKPVSKAPSHKAAAAEEVVAAAVEMKPGEYEEIDQESIVKFFLKLYKVQLGEPQTATSEFRPLDADPNASKTTYELRVHRKKDWESRRMTVGLAGEESTSRSKCFHVIYDNHLIVKIPPKPVTDFEVYLSAIESDQEIVKKLAPRECIVPTVSAVLKIIYPVSKTQSTSAIEIEEKYLERLRKLPQFQEYLKIGHAFVFAMDLSRYFFLGQIINDFHDLKNKMDQEIVGYPDVIWENHGFEGRYAFENDDQVEAVRNVYTDFETKLLHVIKKAGLEKAPARFVMQKWFLLHLAGREIDSSEKDVNPALVSKINMLTRKHFSENKKTIENYLTTIKSCIQTVTLSQNKREIGGLVANILDLVVWLREKGVAMRDLKPDNLLVAGDQKNYPGFLSSVDNYTVGLIDVETAVKYQREDNSELPQPILGGTPSFATPAHLVPNVSLRKFFGDPARILYLQDWYATVGIIFEVITGETLFIQTGKMIVGIKTVMNKHMDDVETQFEMFKKTSRIFWHSAKTELKKKSREKKEILEMVKVAIPSAVSDMFRQELLKQKSDIANRIKRTAKNQNIFKDEKNIKGLIAAPRQKVTQLKKKWKQQYKENKAGIQLLDELEQLKIEAEKQQQLVALFDKSARVLPAYELINFIFERVIQAMYHKEWGELLAAEVAGVAEGSETTTVESTV